VNGTPPNTVTLTPWPRLGVRWRPEKDRGSGGITGAAAIPANGRDIPRDHDPTKYAVMGGSHAKPVGTSGYLYGRRITGILDDDSLAKLPN
jgi:hypothetical protein